jgi:hypothetical protein
MGYLETIRQGCIDAIRKCEENYLALKVVLDYGDIQKYEINEDGTIQYLLNEPIWGAEQALDLANKFLKEHPPRPSDFLTEKDFEDTLEEAQSVIAKLDACFERIHNKVWLTHINDKIDVMERYAYIDVNQSTSFYTKIQIGGKKKKSKKPKKVKMLFDPEELKKLEGLVDENS